MMTRLFVIFQDNYADEFDVYGFALPSEETWQEYLDHLKEEYANETHISWGFGTNQELEWLEGNYSTGWDNERKQHIYAHQTALQRLLSCYDVHEIDDLDFMLFSTVFNFNDALCSWGNFPWLGW